MAKIEKILHIITITLLNINKYRVFPKNQKYILLLVNEVHFVDQSFYTSALAHLRKVFRATPSRFAAAFADRQPLAHWFLTS